MTPTPTSPQPGTGEAFEAGVRAGLEAARRALEDYIDLITIGGPHSHCAAIQEGIYRIRGISPASVKP